MTKEGKLNKYIDYLHDELIKPMLLNIEKTEN